MEYIEPLWTFAAEWKIRALVLIVLVNMFLAVRLYTVMGRKRLVAAKEGRVDVNTYRATQNEPEDVAVFNRAVTNQFESPVLFYALVAMSMALGVTSWLTVVLALGFVALRCFHGNEMIGPHDVLKRRRLFIKSFYVLIGLMVEFAVSAMLWA